MKIGIVFSGQGAQYPGMGRDLYENHAAAKAVFDEAGEEIKDLCFNAAKEMLSQTEVTQPTVYTVTMAAYRAFREAIEACGAADRIETIGTAGFSLGEYAALTSAGAIDEIGKGLRIVRKRGILMQKAGQNASGENISGMTAALGRRDAVLETVARVAEETGLVIEAVNFNTASQTVVAGEKAALARFAEAAKEKRIKAIPLPVSTAFHCALMKPAADELKKVLLKEGLRYPSRDGVLYSDVTAKDIMDGFEGSPDDEMSVSAYLAEMMSSQAKSPVYWQEIIEDMAARGAEAIVEIGPGKTLSGFTKKISKSVIALNIEDSASLAETVRQLAEAAGAVSKGE